MRSFVTSRGDLLLLFDMQHITHYSPPESEIHRIKMSISGENINLKRKINVNMLTVGRKYQHLNQTA